MGSSSSTHTPATRDRSLGLAQLQERARNVVRGFLQAYGTTAVKKFLWNNEFSRGRWACLDRTPRDCVYPYVEKYAGRGSILDLGCGSGSTGNELDAGAYRDYTGVDISDVAIAKAKVRTEENDRGNANRYFQSDIFSYVPSQQFDVILFRDSIYYVPRRRIGAMLHRYSRYLKPGGVFIVRMLNEGDKYQSIVNTIKNHFEIVEEYLSEQPNAIVIVFR